MYNLTAIKFGEFLFILLELIKKKRPERIVSFFLGVHFLKDTSSLVRLICFRKHVVYRSIRSANIIRDGVIVCNFTQLSEFRI